MVTGVMIASLSFQIVCIVVSWKLWRRTRCAGFLLIMTAYCMIWLRRSLGLYGELADDRMHLGADQAWIQIVVSGLRTLGLLDLYRHIAGKRSLAGGV
mgnify:CR=1 FL=1